MARSMKTLHFFRRGLLVVLLLRVLFVVSAADTVVPAQTLRVGFFSAGDCYKKTGDIYGGYAAEYLFEIAKYTGWRYQFVEYRGFEKAEAALERGEIDILPAVIKTRTRNDSVLFSADDMGRIYGALVAPEKNNQYAAGNYQMLTGKKIGVAEGSLEADGLAQWLHDWQIAAVICTAAVPEELYRMLDAHEIDAVAIPFADNTGGYKIIAAFTPEQMYIGMPRGSERRMSELDAAMNKIALNRPEFITELCRKYFSLYTPAQPSFTAEEKSYIAEKHSITVALPQRDPPFAFRNRKGEFCGVLPDLFNRITSLSGLEFSYVGVNSENDAVFALRTGKVMVIAKIPNDQPRLVNQKIRLTDEYLTLYLNEITRNSEHVLKKVAVPADVKYIYRSSAQYAGDKGDMIISFLSNEQDCFELLESGSVDAVFCDTVSSNYFLSNTRALRYTSTFLSGYSYDIAAGVSMETDPRLFSILNQCIHCIRSSEVNGIVQHYTVEKNASLSSVIRQTPAVIISGYVLLLLLIIAAFMLVLLLLNHHAGKERCLLAQQEAVRKGKKANAARAEFFSTVNHDMRTPLNGILGYADLALDTDDAVMINSYLKKIQLSGRMLLDLVDDTIVIARTMTKEIILRPMIFNSQQIIDEILVPEKHFAETNNINFTADLSSFYYGFLSADWMCLKKIMVNVLTTVIRFTSPGGSITCVLSYLSEYRHGSNWKFVIRASEISLADECIANVFRPFTQTEKNTCAISDGTGLDLTVVRHLTEEMNGSVRVAKIKTGTVEFIINLPLTILVNYHESGINEISAINLPGKKVLLCDANDMCREISKAILELKGAEVLSAENCADAYQIYSSSSIGELSAVITDSTMPGMNGCQMVSAIRDSVRSDAKTIPIIAFTTELFSDEEKKLSDAGFDGCMMKPVDPENGIAVLQRAICRRRAATK